MSGGSSSNHKGRRHRLAAADEVGVVRVVEVLAEAATGSEGAVTAKWGEADKQHAIRSLACSGQQAGAVLAVGRARGRVDILDAHSGALEATLVLPAAAAAAAAAAANATAAATDAAEAGGSHTPHAATACPAGDVVALAFAPAADGRGGVRLVAGTSDGVVSTCSSSSSSGGPGGSSGGGGGSGSSWAVVRSFPVTPHLTCLAVDADSTHVVVGCEGQQPAVWELSSGSKVWQGKGAKPDRLGLVDAAPTTAVALLVSGSESPPAAGGCAPGWRFVAGTASAKLRLYDTAAGRRPQKEVVLGESRITAIAPDASGSCAWVATGAGQIVQLALRDFRPAAVLKGAAGSVRALALHPAAGETLLAAAGLDRFARVYDTSSRASRARAYLAQQLTAVAWLPAAPEAAAAAPAAAAAAEEVAPGATEASVSRGSDRKRSSKQQPVAGSASCGGVATKRREKRTAAGGHAKKARQ